MGKPQRPFSRREAGASIILHALDGYYFHLAVILGYVDWTILWLGGNAILFAEAGEVIKQEQAYTDPGPLAVMVGLSILCSITAGLVTAAIAGGSAMKGLWIVAALLLLTGIGVQASFWTVMPLWYHLTFLALLVPMVMGAGVLMKKVTT